MVRQLILFLLFHLTIFGLDEEKKKFNFQIAGVIDGPSKLYPGQRTNFIYLISFTESVKLTESEFPLLNAEGFLKISKIQVKDYEKNGISYQMILQEVEAINPGTFHFDKATIKGLIEGKSEIVSAKSEPMEVTVLPFPKNNQPSSFSGDIGTKLEAELKLISPAKTAVGSLLELKLVVQGPTNLAEMILPPLLCQPGFSGFFELNDLPPEAKFENGKKTFTIELSPKLGVVKEIPPIEISVFDPATTSYIIWRSKPIPLEMQEDYKNLFVFTVPNDEDITALVKKYDIKIEPVEVSLQLEKKDLETNWLFTPYVLFAIPVGVLLLLLQYFWTGCYINNQGGDVKLIT